MPHVATSKEFFVNERRSYADWRFGFWRENFQNSRDAGAKNINITIADHGNRLISVDFDDDGTGMTRQILDDVYFVLGQTTKTGAGMTGGFGRARVLTCFSMLDYTIHTQNNLVQGEGGSYEIAETDYRKGCLLQVRIEDEDYASIYSALTRYLSMSQMSCNVYINGEKWNTWNYRRQMTRQLFYKGMPFANVHVNKSSTNKALYVRVDGSVMFCHDIQAKAQVIVEIEPALSRNILTSNRDGMSINYRIQLDNFLNELATDTLSSLKPKFVRHNDVVRGTGMIRTASLKDRKANKKDTPHAAGEQREAPDVILRSSGIRLVAGAAAAVGFEAPIVPDGYVVDGKIVGLDQWPLTTENETRLFVPQNREPQIGECYIKDLPDVTLIDECDDPIIRRAIEQYNPKNWVVSTVANKTYNKGNTLYKVLMQWKIACEEAMQALMAVYENVESISWGFGWVFADCRARCQSVDGGHLLLLNPVDDKGKLRYSLRDKVDQKTLMAIAKHEVAHIMHPYHNEEHTRLMTDIDACYNEKTTFQKMLELLTN